MDIVEREEAFLMLPTDLPQEFVVHLLLVERGPAVRARFREERGDATAERTRVHARKEVLLRLPPRQEEDELQGFLNRLCALRPDLAYASEFVLGRPLDLPQRVVAGATQRLRLRAPHPGDSGDVLHLPVRELAPDLSLGVFFLHDGDRGRLFFVHGAACGARPRVGLDERPAEETRELLLRWSRDLLEQEAGAAVVARELCGVGGFALRAFNPTIHLGKVHARGDRAAGVANRDGDDL